MKESNGGLDYHTIMKMSLQEYQSWIMAAELLNKPQTKANKLYADPMLEEEYKQHEATLKKNQQRKR